MARSLSICIFALVLSSFAHAAPPAPPSVELDGDAQAGNVTVSWKAPKDVEGSPVYQVQESRQADFAPAEDIYEGTQTARVVSGMPDGSYYYRARYKLDDGFSDWSEAKEFKVEHPSLTFAFSLFGLGALIFVSTAFVIVRGNREAACD